LEERIQEYRILNDQGKMDDTIVKSFQDQLASKRIDLKNLQAQIDGEEGKLRSLLSKVYDYNFQNEEEAILCQPSILREMTQEYEDG
jgi:hypothetical protein